MIEVYPDHTHLITVLYIAHCFQQSKLPQPIPRNSVEPDHGCTSGIYFDNAGDNVTLTSQKPKQKSDCSKDNGLNEIYVFQ